MPSEKIAIQVAYNLNDTVTYEREVGGLRKFLKAYPEYQGYVITRDEENELTIGDKTIQVIPVWKWLLHLPDTRQFNPVKVK